MTVQTSSNKTIAKNTIMLYIRMFISMLVGLYTSRVILQVLGFDDYGIYNVVGGIVSMMGFLNASMAGATSRFITFELGHGDAEKLRDTVSTAILIHIIIAAVVFVVAEVLGLWMLEEKLVIPKDRMIAAHWVLQLSIITACIGIIQTPYMACIISHEKMDIYAYVEMLNVTLKLLIVFLISVGTLDKLVMYAWLMFGVSLIVTLIYRVYCIRSYSESHFRYIWNKSIMIPMLSFSGWDLYGNMGARFYNQGVAFVQNIFFGLTLNAAHGVATTVQGVIQGLSGNVTAAFRPPMIKEYAKGNYEQTLKHFSLSVKLTLVLFLIAVMPAIHELNFLMTFWLGKVPDYAVDICRLLLYMSILQQLQMTMNIIIHATGKIQKLSMMTGTLFILSVFGAYWIYSVTREPLSAYYLFFVLHILIALFDVLIIRRQAPMINLLPLLGKILIPFVLLLIVGSYILDIPSLFIQTEGFLRLLFVCVFSAVFYLPTCYFFLLDSNEKNAVMLILKNKVLKRFVKK